MKFNYPNSVVKLRAVRTPTLFVLVALFVIAATPEARANIWTRKQNYQCGHSASITASSDGQSDCSPPGGSVWPGMPIHIIHGISDLAADATNPVTLKITVPPAFTVTSAKFLRFPAGTSTPITNLASFSIGALGTDKVIVVIDGYFTQAGAYSVFFDASSAKGNDPQFNVNIAVQNAQPPVDLSVTKVVKAPAGSTSVAFGTTVTYQITVTNVSTSLPNGAADLYLGGILTVSDQLSSASGTDVPLDLTVSGFNCTPSSICPTMPSTQTHTLSYSGATYNLQPAMTYASGSNVFLPVGGSFVITFDVLIKTTATCSRGQNNKLNNVASISYAANTNLDHNAGNNTSTPTTTMALTGLPQTPCPTPTPIPAIKVTKTLVSPTTPAWNTPFTYLITITNNSNPPLTLTGLGLVDYLTSSGVPPFTASAPTNVICNPSCTSAPTASAALVNSGGYQATILTVSTGQFAPLAPGSVQTVQFTTMYPAVCAETTAAGSITNNAYLTGPATGAFSVTSAMPALSKCGLDVLKVQTSGPTSFASYPQTLKYHVQFKNPSTQTITVGNVVDSMALDSAQYGNVPVAYSYVCTVSGGVTGIPNSSLSIPPNTPQSIPFANPVWAGRKLIDLASVSPGATFPPNGIVDCNLTVTLQQPSTTDSLCQNSGTPHIVNSAYMALPYDGYANLSTQPTWYQQVTTQIPYCVSILVGKTGPGTAVAGGPVTFNLTVTNTGKDPISNVVLQDNLPAGFTNVTWTCASGCATASGSGNLNVTIAPSPLTLAAGAIVTIVVHATAPMTTGVSCNVDTADIVPFPALTYFEGNKAALETGQACIDVQQSDITPTPTATATITPTPIPGCAQVTDKDVKCLPNGGYSYTFTITNNSGKPMSQILLTPVQGSKFTLTPQLTNLSSPLPNGQSTTVTTTISNVKPGDKVCFFVSLMADKAPCCIVQVCPTLPNCDQATPTPTVTPSLTPVPRQPQRGRRRP